MEYTQAKIIECKVYDDYKLWIRFEDGMSGEVDLKYLVGKGVFSAWKSVDFFKQAHISEISHTVCWGNDDEIDLDPFVLREKCCNHLKNIG